ncbi:MAG: hypothetical protein JWN17_625 [Frankiales bacterium]|nr:hypothetical protein [Frankiales bacterium]
MTRRTAALLLCLLPLAACGTDDAVDPVGQASPTAAAPTSAATTGTATLVLLPDGIALQHDGTTEKIPFGSGTAIVAPALAATLGEPKQQVVECGQGSRTDLGAGGFDVLFDGERFVGWDESGAGLVTDTGLKVGSTRAEVQQALPGVTFSKATLGDEFLGSQGGLAGFLDGAAPTSRVTGLTGGESCVVR